MKKLQQFYILKFNSERLKKAKYNINLSLNQARKNAEIITINNSELIRALFCLKNYNFNQNLVDSLLIEKKKIKNYQNSERNRTKLKEISEKLNKMLFIEELVSIEFKNKAHYRAILNMGGFHINGIHFLPFLASAGMVRKNTALFISDTIKYPLSEILENGRNPKIPIVPVKWGTYFSLYSSSTLPVSFPKFAVIPDKELELNTKVNFIEYQGKDIDDKITEQNYAMKANAWDGQGLIKPKLAKKWSKELELDYTFSSAIIRAPFLKGLVVTFDIDDFATNIVNKYEFTDIYGIKRDIRDYDLIISESMFKLHTAYISTEEYIGNCKKNKLGFSIAKVNRKKEKSYTRTSYQFLQVLNLNDGNIAKLSQPTLNWFRSLMGWNIDNMLLYTSGENKFEPKDFSKLDVIVKAILINPELAKDKYIREKFQKSLNKKIKESYIGKLFVNGNYQFMIGDPYGQASHIFDTKIQALLHRNEYYSKYWLDKNITQVAAIRSPIVHHSELNILNFKKTKEIEHWYKYIHTGIIFPANGIGIDCAIHGGADFDGDIICTINSPTIIKGKIKGLPVVYESQKADKKIVDTKNVREQVEGQLRGHNSKLGFATNISSTLYALLDEFPEDSIERKTILNRLKIGRVIQGEIIDSVKGLEVPPFREHWTKYKKITDDMDQKEKEKWELYNKIVCEIRPAFFRYLYPHYMTRYRKELKQYNIFSLLFFGVPFSELWKKEKRTLEENELIQRYKKRTYFLNNNSTMNRISRSVRTNVSLIKKYSKKITQEYDYNVLINDEIPELPGGLFQMQIYLEEYKNFKKGMRDINVIPYKTLKTFVNYLREQCYIDISSNEAELANYAVEATYGDVVSMVEFPWIMFPDGIIENIMRNSKSKILFPIENPKGNINYLWTNYSLKEFNIEELYEN